MKKKPISTEIIKCILDIHNKKDVNLKNLRIAALCSSAFAGFFRYDELCNIIPEHIEFHSKTQKRQEGTWMDKTGMHLDKFELKRRPTFFQIFGMSVYTCIKLLLPQLESHSQLLCGHDFINERLLVCQFDV